MHSITLKSREVVTLLPIPEGFPSHRHFGIAINNGEAQAYLARGFRVFGDGEGPYLVVRVKDFEMLPEFVYYPNHLWEVTFQPREWHLRDTHSGIICWLEKIQ